MIGSTWTNSSQYLIPLASQSLPVYLQHAIYGSLRTESAVCIVVRSFVLFRHARIFMPQFIAFSAENISGQNSRVRRLQ